MRAKSKARELAESYRKEQGLSYAEISALIGISKSTLSGWLKEILLSEEQQSHLQKKMVSNRASFAERAWLVNRSRFEKAKQEADDAGRQVFIDLPSSKSMDELALAMLYLGEGSKSYGRVQIASTQVSILRYFLAMLKRLYRIDEERICFRLNLVRAASPHENDIIEWWRTGLGYKKARFLKTQYDFRSQAKSITKDYHGVCTLTYCNTYLQRRLLSLATAYIQSKIMS